MGNAIYGVMTKAGDAYVFGTAGYKQICRDEPEDYYVYVQLKPFLTTFGAA